jgi:DNA invertase Pin-like site-specific DNA recombinase
MREPSPFVWDTTKWALVYLRQSSPGQVRDHVLATQEQYRLREIPERLGFSPDRILVVDDDLGVSGDTIAGRKGMLRVLELLERSEAACVVVRDVGRLSRDEFNADMGLIARQCYLSGARIVTPEKTYDPADSSDQLLLGLQGLIAGWDRANIVRRLNHHRKAKQARGANVNGAVPPGYEKIADVPKTDPRYGKLRITSDPEVRDRVRLILQRGLACGGVLAVVRWLRGQGLTVPVWRGAAEEVRTGRDGRTRIVTLGRRSIQWAAPTRDNVTRLLKNPTYAGAIVNSRRTVTRDRATGRRRWATRRAYADCVVIREAHEPYLSWAEHHALLAAIARNVEAKGFSTGTALASGLGLLRCGPCGGPLVVQYHNPVRISRGRPVRNVPYTYECARRTDTGGWAGCQSPGGPYIDRAVTALVLFALETLELNGIEAAFADRRRQTDETARQRAAQMSALERRATMLEAAISEAQTSEARARLVVRFDEILTALQAARIEAAQAPEPVERGVTPELLARLEPFRVPAQAWERFSMRTRKDVLQALAGRIWIYPEVAGYVVAVDWRDGGRAAARVRTARRRKQFLVPDDVLALFDGMEREVDGAAMGSIAACSWMSCQSLPRTRSTRSASLWRTAW